MKCDLSREKLVEYFYGEVNAEKKAGIEAHAKICPSCKQALEEMGWTASSLRAWEDENPQASVVFTLEKPPPWWKAFFPDWLYAGKSRWLMPGLSLGLAGVVLVLSLLNIEVEYGQGAIRASLSLPADSEAEPVTTVLEEPLTRGEFFWAQQHSLALIEELIVVAHEQQRVELGLVLARFDQNLEARRLRDLQLVGESLQKIDWSTESRFMRAEELLRRLLVATYARMDPPMESN